MALKKKINKEAYEKLSDALKAEYTQDGDEYKLDVEGDEDVGALKRAKDREVQNRKDAEKRAKEAEDKLAELEGNNARKNGDIATLEKSWQSKLDEANAKSKAKIDALTSHMTKSLVDNVALDIATKISTAPKLLIPHIRARLVADFEGDEPKTRVLDKDGKPSALTPDELGAEFASNGDFAAIMRAGKASGGAPKPANGGAGKPPATGGTEKPLAAMSPAELAAHIQTTKESGTN